MSRTVEDPRVRAHAGRGPIRARYLTLLVTCLCAAVGLGPTATARASGEFFVPTGKRTGFGAFREAPDSVAALRRAFGPPASEEVSQYRTCIQRWPATGITVTLIAFGEASDPCVDGTFVEARLVDPRWHTASEVHPGGSRASAKRASLRRCRHATIGCGVTGYALELHRTVCSPVLSAGVIAHVRGGRVLSLIVRWRSCE